MHIKVLYTKKYNALSMAIKRLQTGTRPCEDMQSYPGYSCV